MKAGAAGRAAASEDIRRIRWERGTPNDGKMASQDAARIMPFGGYRSVRAHGTVRQQCREAPAGAEGNRQRSSGATGSATQRQRPA